MMERRPVEVEKKPLTDSITLGLVLGALFGTWTLVYTWLAPLADNTLLALASFYGPMFVVWGTAGGAAGRRSGRLWDGVRVGALVAFVTFIVLDVAQLVRVNVFLDSISHRMDWRDLMAHYPNSGFDSLRAYANYVYITGAPFKTLVATFIGAICGGLGALVCRLSAARVQV